MKSWAGRRTLGDVWDGSGDPQGGPLTLGEVRGTQKEVRDESGVTSGRSKGPSERFVTGRGNHEVVQGTLGEVQGTPI